MLSRLIIGLLSSLVLASLAHPACAEEAGEASWALIETTPQGWPQPLYLPDFGDLTMVGYDGATREDVTEPFDFEWFYDAEPGSGDIYLIQGFYLAHDPETPETSWEDYDADFIAELETMGVEISYSEVDAWYGGRRWMIYDLLYPNDEDSDSPVLLLAMVNLDEDNGLTFINVFSDQPVNEDFDAMLSLLIGGPDAPQ